MTSLPRVGGIFGQGTANQVGDECGCEKYKFTFIFVQVLFIRLFIVHEQTDHTDLQSQPRFLLKLTKPESNTTPAFSIYGPEVAASTESTE